MNYQKLTGILSICRKAGRMAVGFDPMREALETGKVCGVITASDISPKTYKEVCYFCQKHNVPVEQLPMDMAVLGAAIGRKAAVVAVTDQGFFDRIRQLCTDAVQEPSE
ncbi:MAG: ribosomal L7Ae/L30e/S12e/Gadd45 family protein [Oscillospiraceae bacterium]|nr:ribosomal L7Ae/L30e/S12e/Gadd45 family protein [Oscillospiraceae bacterium]